MESTLRPTRARLLVLGLLALVAGLAVLSGGLIVWPSKMLESDAEDVAQAAPPPSEVAAQAGQPIAEAEPEVYVLRRRDMVENQLRARDITDPRVLEVMGRVPRHRFVSEEQQRRAYDDHPLPIGHDQTISQPYIVALMTQLAAPKPGDRALDIGTGSGYQAAILAELCKEVYSIEIVEPLAETAKKRLAQLGYQNITVRSGDGYRGWPEHAPFDVIILAAAPHHVPQPLIDQLASGGRLVLPVGGYPQQLTLITKQADGTVRRRTIAPVMFVPMTGEAQRQRKGPADDKKGHPGQGHAP